MTIYKLSNVTENIEHVVGDRKWAWSMQTQAWFQEVNLFIMNNLGEFILYGHSGTLRTESVQYVRGRFVTVPTRPGWIDELKNRPRSSL